MNGTLRRSLLVVGLAFALVAAACGGDDDDNGDAEGTTSSTTEATGGEGGDRNNVDGTVKFGTLVPQSGDLQVIVESLSKPIEMAVEEINAAGGLLGGDVVIVPGDDGTNANVAQTSYDKLLNTDQ